MYYVARNSLVFAYRALRAKDRYAGQVSPYEDFMVKLSEAVNPQRRADLCVPSGDVEAFYQGRISEEEFVSAVHSRIIPKTITISELSALYPLIWDTYVSVPAHQSLCQGVPRLCGRQLWEIFLKLDKEGRSGVHIEEICDLVMRIFKANGHYEKQENIQEWFCSETYIDFWSLMLALAETYSSFLQPSIIQELYDTVMLEVLMRGKLTKKGHMIHTWRDRYFILTASSLTYYETQETLVQKGTISITASTQMQIQPDTKNYQNRFKVVDGLSGTPYEISAPDPQTLQQWNDAIQLAIKIQQVNGRNFLHSYRLAKESLLPSSSVAANFVQSESAAVRKTQSPTTETPTAKSTHKLLANSKSVPLVDEKPQLKSSKISSPNLQKTPIPTHTAGVNVPNGCMPVLDDSLNDPPPLPPKKFSDDSSLNLQGVVPRKPRKHHEKGDKRIPLRRRHSSILQHSDLKKADFEVEHVTVGGQNYAVVKKKASVPGPPSKPITDESPSEQQAALETPEQKVKGPANSSSPRPPRQAPGYVQLHFQSDRTKAQVIDDDTPLPKDVRTKFGYSTIVFDDEPQKDVALARELKKNKPVPAPPPKYDKAPPKPGAPTSETSPRKQNGLGERTLDYADITFGNPDLQKPDSGVLHKSPRLRRKQNSADVITPDPRKPDPRVLNRSPRLQRKQNADHHSLDYADINFSSAAPPLLRSKKVSDPGPMSTPEEEESPYVNVSHQGGPVPPVRPRPLPRQRPPQLSPSQETPPPVPLRKN